MGRETVVKVVPAQVMRAYWGQWRYSCFALDGTISQLHVPAVLLARKKSSVPIV